MHFSLFGSQDGASSRGGGGGHKLGVKRSGAAERLDTCSHQSVSHKPASPAATPPERTEGATSLSAVPVLWVHAQVIKISD